MRSHRQLGLLLLVAACVFFLGLGQLPLTEPDEGRNAAVAREMLVLHDAITPHYDTLPYLDKPAVFFWLVAGSFRVFGFSEWAARLPSALADAPGHLDSDVHGRVRPLGGQRRRALAPA